MAHALFSGIQGLLRPCALFFFFSGHAREKLEFSLVHNFCAMTTWSGLLFFGQRWLILMWNAEALLMLFGTILRLFWYAVSLSRVCFTDLRPCIQSKHKPCINLVPSTSSPVSVPSIFHCSLVTLAQITTLRLGLMALRS